MGVNVNIAEKRFGRKEIFKDFSYSFKDSGLYVIKAKSGAGKTTLLRIIAGLDKDYSGEISGIEHGDISMHFQEYRLFDGLNSLENVTYLSFKNPTEDDIASAKKLLIGLGLKEDELSLFPHELSGGMKMRVSFARAVLKPSRILLLDEPTKELDHSTKEKVIQLINEESKARLVIMVTHESDCSMLLNPTVLEL